MSTVYVFGHKNPDNDAIMSAVMLAQLKNALDDGNTYVPCMLSEGMPKETELTLEKHGIERPMYLERIEPAAEG